jgi:hypothetical protein
VVSPKKVKWHTPIEKKDKKQMYDAFILGFNDDTL